MPGELLQKILAHACYEAPNEVCGWLAGEGEEIGEVYPVPNVAGDPRTQFFMEPEAQLHAMREIRDRGLDLIGTYHSHPRTAALPSVRDRKLATYAEAAHLVVSLTPPGPEARLYRITPAGFSLASLRVL